MKIYEDMYSNQYTENEVETVMRESREYNEEVYSCFLEYLTLDNFTKALFAMPQEFQDKIFENAKNFWMYENMTEIGEISIDDENIEKGRILGQRIIDIK